MNPKDPGTTLGVGLIRTEVRTVAKAAQRAGFRQSSHEPSKSEQATSE
jgi:hypothetical protein